MPNFQLRRGLLCSFVSGLALLVPSVGSAQQAPQRVANGNGEGMDTHLFRPAVDSKGFF